MSTPRIRSVKDVGQIPDLVTAFDVMDQLQIDSNGVNTLNDAVARIKLNFSQRSAHEIYNEHDRVLKEAVQEDFSNRLSLKDLFQLAGKYLESLPEQFRSDLRHVFPDATQQLSNTVGALQRNECIIVVAGEKGSGKSSLINLIAGDKILPADLVHGTRTICELRHSETKRFVLHHWDHSEGVVKECRHDNDARHFLQELTYHVTCVQEQTQRSPYERIDIYWPLPILGEGVVMVDSPGVGESRVSRQLEHYLSRAFGFIYVINISNAGGLQKDRLGQLLRQAVERSEHGFEPSTALFVCNWWDQVTSSPEHVLQKTLERLAKVWPGVKRRQVFPLSAIEALRAVESGHVLDEYRTLVQGIRDVLPTTFKTKLTGYYRWLSAVIKRSLYTLKIYSNMGRKQMAEKEAAFHSIRNQIDALEREQGSQVEVMKDGFKREVDSIIRKLVQFLKSEQCLKELVVWSSFECPVMEKDSKKTAKEAALRFTEKLASIIDKWESENKLVGKVKSSILKTFQRDLELFEDQIKRIEGVLFEGVDNRIITDLHNSMRHQMPVKNVWKKAGKGKELGSDQQRGCLSLGHAISNSRHLDVKSGPVKNVLKAAGGVSMPQLMAELSNAFMQQYKDEELASACKKFFDRIGKRFDAASRLLPEFLKADQHLLQNLQGDVREEQERLAGMYPKLIQNCTALQGKLDMFFVQRLIIYDYSMKDLPYDASKPIGRGAFADVFKCELSNGETVALKIQREKLTVKNVTDVLLEDRTLREINHENIIRYYGAAREVSGGGDLRWVMVLEYCTRTIKQRFMADDANVPCKQEILSLQMAAMVDVAKFVAQICSALCYLHNKGIVHRDLKADNILLTENDVVKLTDVGLAKSVVDIAGTFTGTPAYMAPEILLQRGQYDMKADVFSLAIIIWELWYGQDAADHIGNHLFGRLEDAVRSGLRPSVTIPQKPPDSWLKIMKSGWEFEPANRPTSREVADFFEDFLRKHDR